MIPLIASVLLLQTAPVEVPHRRFALVDACTLTTASMLADARSGQSPVRLIDRSIEFSLAREVSVGELALSIRYGEWVCRSVPEGSCPTAPALASQALEVRMPAADAILTLEDLTWPAGWTDEERGLALKDVPLAFALASPDEAVAGSAIRLGLLELAPGATLKAEREQGPATPVSGELTGTGLAIPLLGTLTVAQGGATLEAHGKSPAQQNGLGQSREDSASLSCSRTLQVATAE